MARVLVPAEVVQQPGKRSRGSTGAGRGRGERDALDPVQIVLDEHALGRGGQEGGGGGGARHDVDVSIFLIAQPSQVPRCFAATMLLYMPYLALEMKVELRAEKERRCTRKGGLT
jgi:hypothetical protein